MKMDLDVRFMESNGTSTRQLDAKSVEATLVQSSSQEFSSSDSTSHETGATIAQASGQEFSIGYDTGFNASASFSFNQSSEVSNTNSWTSEFTQTLEPGDGADPRHLPVDGGGGGDGLHRHP